MTLDATLIETASWIASLATMVAAMMTAANLGARVTGWGFALFAVAALAWIAVAIGNGEQGLLLANLLLFPVNIFGVWRWLGRHAVHEDGARAAAEASREAEVPALFAVAGIVERPLFDHDGRQIGHAVDMMAECGSGRMVYLVAAEGSVASLRERLHAVPWGDLRIEGDRIELDLTEEEFGALPAISPDNWPVRAG